MFGVNVFDIDISISLSCVLMWKMLLRRTSWTELLLRIDRIELDEVRLNKKQLDLNRRKSWYSTDNSFEFLNLMKITALDSLCGWEVRRMDKNTYLICVLFCFIEKRKLFPAYIPSLTIFQKNHEKFVTFMIISSRSKIKLFTVLIFVFHPI